MLKKLLIVFIILPSLVLADDWFSLVSNEKGNIYISQNVSQDGLDRYLVWLKMDEKLKGNKIKTIKMLKVIDCEKRQIGTSVLKEYNSKGALVHDYSIPSLTAVMESPDPDEFPSKLIKEVCRQNGF